MTPAQTLDYGEIARRINVSLSRDLSVVAINRKWFDAARVERILDGRTYSDYADLIREIAAEVERERSGGK